MRAYCVRGFTMDVAESNVEKLPSKCIYRYMFKKLKNL